MTPTYLQPNQEAPEMLIQPRTPRCAAVKGKWWCSRDAGHADAHESRCDDGPGLVAWFNASAPPEDHAFVESPYGPDRCRDCEHPESWHASKASTATLTVDLTVIQEAPDA